MGRPRSRGFSWVAATATTPSCFPVCKQATWSSQARADRNRKQVRKEAKVRVRVRAPAVPAEEAGPYSSAQVRAVEASSNGHVKEAQPAIEVRELTKDYHLASNVVHAL